MDDDGNRKWEGVGHLVNLLCAAINNQKSSPYRTETNSGFAVHWSIGSFSEMIAYVVSLANTKWASILVMDKQRVPLDCPKGI